MCVRLILFWLQLLVQCEASYAFSAVGALEGARALATGNFVALSEQNVLDCSGTYDSLRMQAASVLLSIMLIVLLTMQQDNYEH